MGRSRYSIRERCGTPLDNDMKRYRPFSEVYPNEQFDVDKAWKECVASYEGKIGYTGLHEELFKAGWEAAEKKLMSIEED